MPTCMNPRPLGAQFPPTFHRPFLRYFDGDQGGAPGEEKPKTEEPEFPANTAVADMTPEQQAAYWRAESKKHQKDADAYRKLGTVETVQKTIDDAETARTAALTDQQKAIEDATTAGKTAGYAEAREKLARPAVETILVASTRTAGETPEAALTRVKGILEVVDVQKFVGDDGSLDTAKVETFAQSLAPSAANGDGPGRVSLQQIINGQQGQQPGHGGSVSALEQQYYDDHFKKS